MKILLDENIPHDVRPLLMPMHEPITVAYMKWKGIGNGKLLSLAAAHGFDLLLTTDKGIQYQQNQATLACSVVLIEVPSNRMEDIKQVVPRLLAALSKLKARSFQRVS